MANILGGGGGGTMPLPAPRVSTPEPLNVPTWDDQQLADLDSAYQNYYGYQSQPKMTDTYQPTPTTNGLNLKPLSQWRDDSLMNKLAEQAAKADALAQQAGQVAGTRLGFLLGGQAGNFGGGIGQTGRSMIPSGKAGLSAYGVSKSGAANQRGKGYMGLQSDYWGAMQKMFGEMQGRGLGRPGITDGWRSYEQQVSVKKRKGNLAATPGRSVHGIGYAADLALNSAQQRWMEANAWRYGIYRLASEPWHWQYWPASKR